MKIEAVRDDGALLVTAGGRGAAIVGTNDEVWGTSAGSALARGEWDEPGPEHVVPQRVRESVSIVIEQMDRELGPLLLAPMETGSNTNLTAAAETHTGAMIALMPSEANVERLAVSGGEDAEELHVTLCYLGKAVNFPEDARAALVDRISEYFSRVPAIEAEAFAVALFNPPGTVRANGDELPTAVVLLLNGDGLALAHSVANVAVEELDLEVPEQHEPWMPHTTLAYTEDTNVTPYLDRTGPVLLDIVRVAFGDDVYDIPLGEGGDFVAAFDPKQSRAADDDSDGEPGIALMKERDVNAPGGGHNLRNYWVRGEGAAKIGWGTDGSFDRCVGFLSEHVKNPQGLCAEYHKAATGEWPAEKGVPSHAQIEAFKMRNGGDMPWHIEKRGDEFCVIKDADDSTAGCHPSKAAATAQLRALYASEDDMSDDTVVMHGTHNQKSHGGDKISEGFDATRAQAKKSLSDAKEAIDSPGLPADVHNKARSHIRAAIGAIAARDWHDAIIESHAAIRTVEGWKKSGARSSHAKGQTTNVGRSIEYTDETVTANGKDESFHTVEVEDGKCPPNHHMMPNGTCMPDEEMKDTNTKTDAYTTQSAAPWRGVLTVEGIESGDGRMFHAGSLTWDEPPLPLMWQKETSHGGQGDVSVRVGNIDRISRVSDPKGRADVNLIVAEGTLDLNNPDGAEVYRRMGSGYMRGNSVDVDSVKNADVELVYPETTAGPITAEDDNAPVTVAPFAPPELTVFHRGRIRASTLVEIPAFTEARLELVNAVTADGSSPEKSHVVEETVEVPESDDDITAALIAATSVIEISDAPPREWFAEPRDVEARGALTVTAQGRVYGYLAPAGVRHRAFTQREQYVPLKNVDYSRFMGGETIVADGGRVTTGVITMDCGHATTVVNLSAEAAAEHYDNTCSIVATARVGENRDGVWIAGALTPGVTAEQVQRMMACRLSGDWRAHLDRPGHREFVAALLVPVPGFPMARTAPSVSLRDGQLVAAAVPLTLQVTSEEHTLTNRDRVALLTRRVRVQQLRSRVSSFHGTHNQKSHGKRGLGGPDVKISGDANAPGGGGDTPDRDKSKAPGFDAPADVAVGIRNAFKKMADLPDGKIVATGTSSIGEKLRLVRGSDDQDRPRLMFEMTGRNGTGPWMSVGKYASYRTFANDWASFSFNWKLAE